MTKEELIQDINRQFSLLLESLDDPDITEGNVWGFTMAAITNIQQTIRDCMMETLNE